MLRLNGAHDLANLDGTRQTTEGKSVGLRQGMRIREHGGQTRKRNPLATTYFPRELPPKYRLRWSVSLPCSGWDQEVPCEEQYT